MDIYSCINSKAVAEHCRRLGFAFDTEEQAYIIDACDHITLCEKHQRFQELMRTMSDFTIEPKLESEEPESFFSVLQQYILAQNKALHDMEQLEDCVFEAFDYDLFYNSDDDENVLYVIYSSFYEAYDEILFHREQWAHPDSRFCGNINAFMLSNKRSRRLLGVEVGLNGMITDVCSDDAFKLQQKMFCRISPDHLDIEYCPKRFSRGGIPVPFQPGDLIVIDDDGLDMGYQNPCIFKSTEQDDEGRYGLVFRLDSDRNLAESGINLFSADYYRGEMTPDVRLLTELAEPFLHPEQITVHTVLSVLDDERYDRIDTNDLRTLYPEEKPPV